MIAMPSILNVGGLLFLIIYIYAILGIQLFAKNMLADNLNSHANFQSMHKAFITLLRAATGEAWDVIRNDLSQEKSLLYQCKFEHEIMDENRFEPIECGNAIGQIYFFTYSLLVQLIFLNLFVAIILQTF